MRTLVVAAHPDDEVLGCGATIARFTQAGEEVHVLILGEGVTSRREASEQAQAEALTQLGKASREAGRILGVQQAQCAGLPDNRLDTVPLLEVVQHIEDAIERLAPERVLCQHGGDLNVDHMLTFRATMTATRPQPGHPVKEVLAFEVASSSEWAFGRFAPAFMPDTFVDVTETLDRKLEALQAYGDEMRPWPHPRSVEHVRTMAQRWGSVVGVRAAEAFQTVRRVV